MKINFLNIAKRAGWISGFTGFYFFVIRPFRAIYSEHIIYERLLSSQHSVGNITSAFHSPRQVLITYMSNGSEIVMSHIPQFGFFFLLGMIGIIVLKAGREAYFGLSLFQLIVEVIVMLFFWLGVHYTIAGFILSDFLMTYISPLGCLGFVVFVWMKRGSGLQEYRLERMNKT